MSWAIHFLAKSHLFQTGIDPINIMHALASLGELSVEADVSHLPLFSELDPQDNHLTWQLTLRGTTTQDEIAQVFERFGCISDVTISPVPTIQQTIQDDHLCRPELLSAISSESSGRYADTKTEQFESAKKISSFSIDTDKVDSLMNLVGEVSITQSKLTQLAYDSRESILPQLVGGLEQLEKHTREMQTQVLQLRMLPIRVVVDSLRVMLAELTQQTGIKSELIVSGEQTELDYVVVQKLITPLCNLVRSVLELTSPQGHNEADDSENNVVQLNAYQQAGDVMIEIQAGFLTADVIKTISFASECLGEMQKIIERLAGNIDVEAVTGQKTTFFMRLPASSVMVQCQIIRLADEIFLLPFSDIVETVTIKSEDVEEHLDKNTRYCWRGKKIPVILLEQTFDHLPHVKNLEERLLLVLVHDGQTVGLVVDEVQEQQQAIIKSLETNYRKVTGISAATLMNNGNVAFILDIAEIIQCYTHE